MMKLNESRQVKINRERVKLCTESPHADLGIELWTSCCEAPIYTFHTHTDNTIWRTKIFRLQHFDTRKIIFIYVLINTFHPHNPKQVV